MRRHLLLLTFTLILSHFSILNLWAGEQYILPVTSSTPCGGSSVENKLDNNTQVIFMADNNNSWADFNLNIPAAKTFLLYVGYSSNKSGNLRPFTNDTQRGEHGFSTSTGWYDVKEINCGANGVLQAGNNKISICNNGANFNLMYIRLEEQGAATWDVPVDMNIYWTTKDGEVITNSDFSYVKTSDGTPKADMVDNANTSGKVFMKEAITATSRKNVYFPTTGTYCFTFPIYVKDHATYSMPTITVNGNTSSATSVTTETDNEFKDVTIELDVTAGTYPVVINYSKTDDKIGYRYVTITKKPASCTAPNHVDVTATAEVGNYGWRYSIGETLKLTATPYSSAGTGSPITSGVTYQWKKKTGATTWKDLEDGVDGTDGGTFSGTTSANLVVSGLTASNAGTYKCVASTGSGCDTESNEFWVRVFTFNGNYSGSSFVANPIVWTDEFNGTATVTLNANSVYEFKVYDNDSHTFGLSSPDIYKDENNFVIYRNDGNNVALHTGNVAGTYTFTVNVYYSNYGDNPYITLTSVRYPKKMVYMACGSTTWCDATPVFFAHSYSRVNTDVKMTKHTCEDVYYAEVPSYNANLIFTRQKAGSESIAWDGDNFYNKSQAITVGSNDLFTCTGWSNNEGTFSGSSYSPTTYTISFAGNGNTSGSMTDVDDIECEGEVTLEENGYIKTGYNFANWKTNVAITANSSAVAANGAVADEATISDITSDITLTAQWTAKQSTITFDKEGGSSGSDGATGTYGSAMPSITAPTRTGYDFGGYWDGDNGTGNQYYKADGTSYAIWNKDTEDGTTLYAKWTAKSYTVTLNTNDGTINAGNVTSYTYGVGATLPTNVTKSDNRFMGWYDNSFFTGSPVTTISTSATENKEYWARWATLYTITNGNPSNGTINVNSTAIEGETVSILATPSSGYAFNEWSIYKTGDASTTISPASVAAATSFTMPAYGVTVTATFEEEECFSGLVIQCEDYVDYTTKPSGSTDNYPTGLSVISNSEYGTAEGGSYARGNGTGGEMWIPVTLPVGSFTFTIRCGHAESMWFNLYDASNGTKLQYNRLVSSWTENLGNYTISAYDLSAGNYIIGLYGDNGYSAFDQVEIVKQSDAPCAAPSSPTYPECNVMSVYSPHYETNVGLTYANWGGATTNQTPEAVLGEKVLKVTTNSSYTYFGLDFGCATTGVDVSSYSTVEFDVWTPVATSFRFFPINRNSTDSGNDTEYYIDVTTSASIWKHISIDVSAYTGQGLGMNRVYQFKLDQISQQTTLWLTNFIFYDADAACATKFSVTTADDGHGTAVADDDEYEEDATVTITATPSLGYRFSSWTITKDEDDSDVTSSVSLSGQTKSATFTMPDYNVTVTANFVARAVITTPTVEAESGIYEDPINISLEATSYQYSHPVVVFFVSDGTTTYEVTGAPYGSAGNSLGSIGADGVDYQTVHKATFTATKAATYTVIAKLYEGELVDNFETENFMTWSADNAGTGGAVTYEDNSSKTAVNGSNQVLKIYCASDAADWGGAVLRFIAEEERCLGKDYGYLHVRMKDATSNSKLKISDNVGSTDDIAPSLGSEAGDWKNVTYARGERCKFDFLLFMINRGGSGGGTVYIDDVILSNESSMTIKATSSSASVAIAKVFTGDGADANWNTTANWSDGAVSTINDVVYIRKPAVINVTNAKAKSIILDQSSSYTGSIEIQSGKELVIATTLKKTTDGSAMIATGVNDVFINSNASKGLGALVMGTHDGTNKATVNFYTRSHGSSGSGASVNQYVGTPFNDETNILYNWYNSWVYGIVYDGSGKIGWERVNEGSGMTPFKGYTVISADPEGHSYWQQGTLVATTNQTISGLNWQSGSGAANENNENLLANSWMAPIKIAAMQSTDFVRTDATIYIFNSTSPDGYKSGGFASNYTTYTVGTAGKTDIIPAMQSFSVFTNASGGSSVTLDYSKIVYDPAVAGTVPAPNRAPQRRTSAEEANKLRLFVSAESGYGDMVYMWEGSDFAEGFENGWDGRKVFGEPVAPQLYAVTPDGNMAVNCVPDFEGTLLGFQAGTSANSYTFTFEYTDEAEELYLRDMDTNGFTRVMNGNSYTFTTSDRTSHNRFVLTKNAPQSPTDIAETGDGLPVTGARKVIINDHVYLIRGGKMFSVDGQLVK